MKSEEELKKQGILIFKILGCVVAGIVIYYFTKPKNDIDRRTFCPPEINRETVIVLDRSSEVSKQTQAEITERIKNIIYKKVQVGERITFYEVNDNAYTNLSPIDLQGNGLDFCKPKDRGENMFVENDSVIHRMFEEKIKKIVNSPLINNKGAESKSPIAQVVFDASLSRFMLIDKKFDKDKKVSFYLFSDLMENSKDVSLYNCSNSESAISKFKVNRAGRYSASDRPFDGKEGTTRPIFRNIANFEIHLVPTHQAESVLKCRDKFWLWYLGVLEFAEDLPQEDKIVKPVPLPG